MFRRVRATWSLIVFEWNNFANREGTRSHMSIAGASVSER